jgi:hypothetical protein
MMEAETRYMQSWLEALRDLPGNPFGIVIRQFGGSTAFLARRIATSPIYNRVMSLGLKEIDHINSILSFYHEMSILCCLDLNPYLMTPGDLACLAKYSLYQANFQTIVYGLPTTDVPDLPNDIEIREVQRDEMDKFVEIYNQGFSHGDATRVLYDRPGWHLYFALLEDIPVAVNTLHIQANVTSIVDMTTLPSKRGRGCQTALLYYSIKKAALEGSNLIVTQTRAGTTSQANMQRTGLQIAGTNVWWMEKSVASKLRNQKTFDAFGTPGAR